MDEIVGEGDVEPISDAQVLNSINDLIEQAKHVVTKKGEINTQARMTAALLILVGGLNDVRPMIAIGLRQLGFTREDVMKAFRIDVPKVPADSPIKLVSGLGN